VGRVVDTEKQREEQKQRRDEERRRRLDNPLPPPQAPAAGPHHLTDSGPAHQLGATSSRHTQPAQLMNCGPVEQTK